MCTGCADALDHSQHQISEQGPEGLLTLLRSCGHAPQIYDAETGKCSPVFDAPPDGGVRAGTQESVCASRAPETREEALSWLSSQKSSGADVVETCSKLFELCSLQVEKIPHIPVVPSEGQTSNEHHHVVLKDHPEGHIVVSLFMSGKKKKSKCLVVKKPTTRPDLKALGTKLAAAGLPDKEYRLADEGSMLEVLGVGKDFASPLALVQDTKGAVDLVVIDAELDDGKPLWCLPPGRNDTSWRMSLGDCERFAGACGSKTMRTSLS